MGKTLVICGFFAWAIVWITQQEALRPCNCAVPVLPQNHFIVDTYETETCVDKNRNTIVTREVKSSKVSWRTQ